MQWNNRLQGTNEEKDSNYCVPAISKAYYIHSLLIQSSQ